VAEAIAETTRGGRVESIHHGVIAVADTEGNLRAVVGDPDHVVFYRSSAKPFQAVPLVESGGADAFGFTAAELALCCASHVATERHQAAVAAMLRKIGLDETSLRCGAPLPSDRDAAARVLTGATPKSQLQCDCSGKHTGMLATCLHLGETLDDYRDPHHPLQQRILGIISEVLRTPKDEIPLGIDGCSLPTFGGSMRSFAVSYAALAAPERVPSGAGREHADALNRLRSAMMAHPENVSGEGRDTTDLVAVAGGRIVAKGGAEGLFCFGLPEHGVGVAIRVLDGSFRAHASVAAAVLDQLDLVPSSVIEEFLRRHPAAISNHNGIEVGEIQSVARLRQM
jgi:L-asparaginase II